MQRVLKHGDIQNTGLLLVKTDHFDIKNAFLHRHKQELQTFKNGSVSLASSTLVVCDFYRKNISNHTAVLFSLLM